MSSTNKTVQFATLVSTFISFIIIIVCSLSVSLIYSEVNSLWTELDTEMGEFKATSNDLWKELMSFNPNDPTVRARRQALYQSQGLPRSDSVGTGGRAPSARLPVEASLFTFDQDKHPAASDPQSLGSQAVGPPSFGPSDILVPGFGPSLGTGLPNHAPAPFPPAIPAPPPFPPPVEVENVLGRPANFAGNFGNQGRSQAVDLPPGCNCDRVSRCPPGLPGPPGNPGYPGVSGIPGPSGIPGKDASDVQPEIQQRFCYFCPPGRPGSPGPRGSIGMRGKRGPRGLDGMSGRNSPPGKPGDIGSPGLSGPRGRFGPQGAPGSPTKLVVGASGAKGERGLRGPAGERGRNGVPGTPSDMGPQGAVGPPGPRGTPGFPGSPGLSGLQGAPGHDGVYCRCPNRNYVLPVNPGQPEEETNYQNIGSPSTEPFPQPNIGPEAFEPFPQLNNGPPPGYEPQANIGPPGFEPEPQAIIAPPGFDPNIEASPFEPFPENPQIGSAYQRYPDVNGVPGPLFQPISHQNFAPPAIRPVPFPPPDVAPPAFQPVPDSAYG